MIVPILTIISTIQAILLLLGVRSITRTRTLRETLLITSLILGSASLLDSIGIYFTVPLASFLYLLGIYELIKRRVDRDLKVVFLITALVSLDPFISRDVSTYYSTQAYYVVTHDPRFFITDISNAVAIGLYSSIAFPYLLLGRYEYLPYLLRGRGILGLAALIDFVKRELRPRDEFVWVLLFFSIPYRTIHEFMKPDYLDRLFALSVLVIYRGIFEGHDDRTVLGFVVYALGKQSRPSVAFPVILLLLKPRYRTPIIAAAGAYIFYEDILIGLYVAPALRISLTLNDVKADVKRFLKINPRRAFFLSPLAFLRLREIYFVGWPLGTNMLNIGMRLGLIHGRLPEAMRVLEERPKVAIRFIPPYVVFNLLPAYMVRRNVSITQNHALAFVTRRYKRLLRSTATMVLLRSVIVFVYPRQAPAFRISVVIAAAEEPGALLYRIPTLFTRAYSVGFHMYLGLIQHYRDEIQITIMFVVSVFLIHAIASRAKPRIRHERVMALLILVVSVGITITDKDKIDYYLNRQEALYERAENIKSTLGSGGLITAFTPGFVEGMLLPNFRLYQLLRVYEYPYVQGILKADDLGELKEELIGLEVKAFVYADVKINRVSYFSAQYLLFNDTLLSRFLLSSAARYVPGIVHTIYIRDYTSRVYLVSISVPTKGAMVNIYGNGMIRFTPLNVSETVARILSEEKIISVNVRVSAIIEGNLEVYLETDSRIERSGDLYTVHINFTPASRMRSIRITLEVHTISGTYRFYSTVTSLSSLASVNALIYSS